MAVFPSSVVIQVLVVVCLFISVEGGDTGTVLVTGAAGFIGSHLMVNLKKVGYNVVGIDNFNSYYSISLKRRRAEFVKEKTGFEVIDGELCDVALLHRLFNENQFSHIVNLAAQPGVRYSFVNPMQYVEYNLECFTTMLEAVKTQYVQQSRPVPRFLYASSSSVYGLNKKVPFSELDPIDTPSNLYGATKAANELIAHSYHHLYGITTVGFRFFTVYGPFGRPDMAASLFADKILHNESLTLFDKGEMMRDFTYVDDIVAGVTAAVERKEDDQNIVYNLGNTHPIKTGYFLSLLENLLGKKANFVHKKSVGEMAVTFSNISLAQKNLNYAPQVSIEDGLERFVNWFKTYETALSPCASSCSSSPVCFPSGWDEVAAKSRQLTEHCSLVFYTINTPPKADKLHSAPKSTVGCNIAFVYEKSVLYLREAKKKTYNNWILLPVNDLSVFSDPRKATRLPKISPDLFFAPSVRYAIYGDSSVILMQTPQYLIDHYSRDSSGKEAVLAAMRHPYSKTIAEEVAAVLHKTIKLKTRATHYPSKLIEQNKAYESLRRVEPGLEYVNLFDGCFLVHKLQSKAATAFRCKWYREYQEWADRDQVPGSFVVNKMMYDYNQQYGQKESVAVTEWMPVSGERRSDGSMDTNYVHVISSKLHPYNSRKIVMKEKFPYVYKR